MTAQPIAALSDKTLLNRVVAATVAVQAAIVMSSLTVPVLASVIAPAVGVPAYWVGYYSALIYGFAVVSSFGTPRLFRKWGGIRLHQGMLVMTAAALAALLPAFPLGFAASAIVLGLGYGPMNPASTVLLARYTPQHLRSRVFSLKQTAVPVGGALAGLTAPVAAAALGWRGAIALIAVVCVGIGVLIQPWREAIDRDSPARDGPARDGPARDGPARDGSGAATDRPVSIWAPLRLMLEDPGLRATAFASFAFGAVQFCFTSVFPTVLAHVGWTTAGAGRAMSVALIVGVVFRVIWGTVADKIGSRPILCLMGAMMSAAAFVAAFVGPGWSWPAVALLAALFGLSAFCWAGIGIAEAVRQVAPAMVVEASAGIIAATFFGALVGPTLFSAATALTGSVAPAFVILGVLSAVGAALLLRPRQAA